MPRTRMRTTPAAGGGEAALHLSPGAQQLADSPALAKAWVEGLVGGSEQVAAGMTLAQLTVAIGAAVCEVQEQLAAAKVGRPAGWLAGWPAGWLLPDC
jgi:hypothetical protein